MSSPDYYSQLCQEVQAIIKKGGVLLIEIHSYRGTRFLVSVGPYYTATKHRCQYAYICNNTRTIYRSPLHAAQKFVGTISTDKIQKAINTYKEDNL